MIHVMEGQSELSKRVSVGLAGAALLLLIIIFGGVTGTAFLTVILSLGMVYEFVNICFSLPDLKEKRSLLLGLGWLVHFTNYWIPRAEYELLLIAFFFTFGYFLFTAGRHDRESFPTHFKELMYSIFGLLYLVFLPLFFVLIRDSRYGARWAILFLLIVWLGDTAAYFVGKRYGKRKLYPLISPKKTIEGAQASLAMSLVVALLYKILFFPSLHWSSAILISILISISSQVGDLCESFLKRAFNRKDSSSILPGHGGMLDRFDGVVFSLPIMYMCMRILG